jgi:predicted ester cyclase
MCNIDILEYKEVVVGWFVDIPYLCYNVLVEVPAFTAKYMFDCRKKTRSC